jgi:hypothetical protein
MTALQKRVRASKRTPKKPTVADRLRARMEREARLNAKVPPTPLTEKLLNINASAQAIGVSPWTLRHWLAEGRLNYRRIGRRVYLTESEITRLAGSEFQAVNAA